MESFNPSKKIKNFKIELVVEEKGNSGGSIETNLDYKTV